MASLNIGRWNDMIRIFACGMCALLLVGLLPISGHTLDRDWRKVGWERVELSDVSEENPWVEKHDDDPTRDTRSVGRCSQVEQAPSVGAFFLSTWTRLLIPYFEPYLNSPHTKETTNAEAGCYKDPYRAR